MRFELYLCVNFNNLNNIILEYWKYDNLQNMCIRNKDL